MKGLQCLPLAAAVAAAAPGNASAGEDWTGGFVLGAQERTILQDTPLNRDNFLGIAGSGTRAVALFEGRQQDFTWRVRTEAPIDSGGVSFCQRSRSALRAATVDAIGRGCDASSVNSARLR